MGTRLVLETECEHGGFGSHQMPGVDVFDHGDVRRPGGSRVVLDADRAMLVEVKPEFSQASFLTRVTVADLIEALVETRK